MHDPAPHPSPIRDRAADPAVELARLRRRTARLVGVFAVLVAVALGVGIVSTELGNLTASAVLLAVSAAAAAAMSVLTVVLLRLAARVKGIHRHARNPPG